MIETFEFPLPPTLNQIIGTARRNPYTSASEKRQWTQEIALWCLGRHQFPGQVWLEFVWRLKNWRRDPDNVAAAAKYICDGMVEAGVILDDSLKIIQSPVLHWYERDQVDSVLVRIADCPIWGGQLLKTDELSPLVARSSSCS